MEKNAGYRELEHTADWQLEAWAPDLTGLLEQCAHGMQALSGAKLDPQDEPVWINLELSAADAESLLVRFLSELLFLSEQESIGFERLELGLEKLDLHARLRTRALLGLEKEIKAVTYHNLIIDSGPEGLSTRVVFDV
jgi:SHS2 domain-containing protein